MTTIDILPDELLQKIFACLSAVDVRCKTAQVCKRWRRLSLDPFLWKSLKFHANWNLSLRFIKAFIQNTPQLQILRSTQYQLVKIIQDIRQYTNLREYYSNGDITEEMLYLLPSSITVVSVRRINVTKPVSGHLPNLQRVDVQITSQGQDIVKYLREKQNNYSTTHVN